MMKTDDSCLLSLIVALFFLSSSCLLGDDEEEYIDPISIIEDEMDKGTDSTRDPLRKFNKVVFGINDFIYMKIFKPVSKGYRYVIPDPVEKSIRNAYDNIGYPVRFGGNVLQLKFGGAARETVRFAYNSTVGVGGLFNPSKEIAWLNPPREDIGQALGKWGIRPGVYIVLPLTGPTTLRDFVGGFGNGYMHPLYEPWEQIEHERTLEQLQKLNNISRLPGGVETYEAIRDAAIDPYEAAKDAYLQKREAEIKK